MPGGNVGAEALQFLMSQVGPQVAANQGQYAGYQQQLGALGAGVAQEDAYAQAQAAFQQAGLGISGQQLGIQQQQLGLQEQGQTLGRTLAFQQQGYEKQEFQDQQKQALENYMYSLKNLQGQQAVSGAAGAPGQFRDTANLSQNFNTQSALANLGQLSEEAGFAEQYGGTAGGVNYGAGQYGLTQQQNQLAQQNLSLIAQSNGLSEAQVVEQLNYQLAQNKQAGISSAGQLLGQMGNLAAGQVSALGTALAPIGYSAGINYITAGTPGV